MMRVVTWLVFGKITGFLTSCGRSARLILPPTQRIPSLLTIGSSFLSELLFFTYSVKLCTVLPCWLQSPHPCWWSQAFLEKYNLFLQRLLLQRLGDDYFGLHQVLNCQLSTRRSSFFTESVPSSSACLVQPLRVTQAVCYFHFSGEPCRETLKSFQ